jgi:hypothetical protein
VSAGVECVPPTYEPACETTMEARFKKEHRFLYDQLDIDSSKQAANASKVAYLPIKW